MATSTTLTPAETSSFMGQFGLLMAYDAMTSGKPDMPKIDYERFRDDDETDKDNDRNSPPPPVTYPV